MSTRTHHTCCSAATHNDSKSRHLELRNVRSSREFKVRNRWSWVLCASSRNATPPMFTFSWSLPSLARAVVGTPMSELTWASTLVSPRVTATVPQSAPKVSCTSRHSLERLPSSLWFCFTACWTKFFSALDFPGSNRFEFINIVDFWICFGFVRWGPAFKNVHRSVTGWWKKVVLSKRRLLLIFQLVPKEGKNSCL